MIEGLQLCPKCRKLAVASSISQYDRTSWIVSCGTLNCNRAFAVERKDAERAWNRLRGPRVSLDGDELGAHVPDALARQQILSRLTIAPKSYVDLIGEFPWKRIERHLSELVESGEAVKENMPVGDGFFGLKRDTWRLATEPLPPPARAVVEITSPRNGVPDMAKAPKPEEQLELIEVKDALAKNLEEKFSEYGAETRKKNKANKAMKEIRADILQKIKKRGIKPDADGVISFLMNGKKWVVEPGESKLRVTEMRPERADDGDAGDDDKP